MQVSDPSGRPAQEFKDFLLHNNGKLRMESADWHEEGHYGDKKLYHKVWADGYYWETMRKHVNVLVQ